MILKERHGLVSGVSIQENDARSSFWDPRQGYSRVEVGGDFDLFVV